MAASVPNDSVHTLSKADFEHKLGRLGAELFERLNPADQDGHVVAVLNVREARRQMRQARLPGCGKVVMPERSGGDGSGGDGFLMIAFADLAEAFEASQASVDWARSFAPRPDLPAAKDKVEIRRGPRGRRFAL